MYLFFIDDIAVVLMLEFSTDCGLEGYNLWD